MSLIFIRTLFLSIMVLSCIGCLSLLHLFMKYRLLNTRFYAFGVFFLMLAVNFGVISCIALVRWFVGMPVVFSTWLFIGSYSLLMVAIWYLAWQLWRGTGNRQGKNDDAG